MLRSISKKLLNGVRRNLLGPVEAASGPDWANFDNSLSGAEQLIVTGGGVQIGMACPLTSTAGVAVYYDSTQLKTVGFTINSDDTITEGSTPANVTGAAVSGLPEKPIVMRLSDTRAVCMSWMEASLAYHIGLIGWSAGEAAVVDTHTITGWTTAHSAAGTSIEWRIEQLSATKFLMLASDDDGVDEMYVAVLDLAGDTITEGTRALAYGATTFDSPTAIARPGICRLTDTSFAVATTQDIGYFTVSGTTPTWVSGISILAANTNVPDDRICKRLADDKFILFYEGATANTFDCCIYTVTEGVISRGTPVEGIVTGAIFFCEQETIDILHTDDDGNSYIGLVVWGATLTVLKVEQDNTITKVVDAQSVSTSAYEHVSIFSIPGTGGARALIQSQEETTSPVKQIGLRVLVA